MRVKKFDLERGIWILPAERSKAKKAIRRALSIKVIELIKSLNLPYGREREFLILGQRFILKLRNKQTLLIAHNIDLAPRVVN